MTKTINQDKLITIEEINEYVELGIIKPHLVGLHRFNKHTELCD